MHAEIARSRGRAEIEALRRLTGAFADISESIRERSRIATGTSFLFCGGDPRAAGAAAGSGPLIVGPRLR
jgi:hypothetical protein